MLLHCFASFDFTHVAWHCMIRKMTLLRDTFNLPVALHGLPVSVQAWIAQLIVFHVAGLMFEWCDRTGVLRQFKVRATERRAYARVLPRVVFNQCFILLPSMILAQASGICFSGAPVLPLSRFFLSLPTMAVGHDVIQYLAHRYLLHQPNIPLMRALQHSLHHSTRASMGISACYMSGPDFFLEIVLPYLLPLAIIGGGESDALFHTVIAGLGALGGIYEHSGYDFSVTLRQPQPKNDDDDAPGLFFAGVSQILAGILDNRAHNEHHSRANVSFSDGFGSPGICDTIFKTRWDLVPKNRPDVEAEWQAQRSAANSN